MTELTEQPVVQETTGEVDVRVDEQEVDESTLQGLYRFCDRLQEKTIHKAVLAAENVVGLEPDEEADPEQGSGRAILGIVVVGLGLTACALTGMVTGDIGEARSALPQPVVEQIDTAVEGVSGVTRELGEDFDVGAKSFGINTEVNVREHSIDYSKRVGFLVAHFCEETPGFENGGLHQLALAMENIDTEEERQKPTILEQAYAGLDEWHAVGQENFNKAYLAATNVNLADPEFAANINENFELPVNPDDVRKYFEDTDVSVEDYLPKEDQSMAPAQRPTFAKGEGRRAQSVARRGTFQKTFGGSPGLAKRPSGGPRARI